MIRFWNFKAHGCLAAAERGRSAAEGSRVWKVMTDPTFAALTAIRHWSRTAALVRFALDRHGFADSNGGFGITYPGDLDEYDREVLGRHIPDGFVLAYGFWGPPDGYEVFVSEWLYRDVLAEVLECLGMWREAASVRVPEGWLGPSRHVTRPATDADIEPGAASDGGGV